MPSLNVACVSRMNCASSIRSNVLKSRKAGNVASAHTHRADVIGFDEREAVAIRMQHLRKAAAHIQPAEPPPTITMCRGECATGLLNVGAGGTAPTNAVRVTETHAELIAAVVLTQPESASRIRAGVSVESPNTCCCVTAVVFRMFDTSSDSSTLSLTP